MKTKEFYILNEITDASYDPNENRFYLKNWEPELTDNKV